MAADPPESGVISAEDRALIRRIGSQLRQIIRGVYNDVQDVDRLDELGILANMANRVARELQLSRERDQRQLEELRQAHITQQQLLETIAEVSTPALTIYDGVLLLPLIGALDSTRAQQLLATLLERTEQTQARVVILDITGANMIDTHVANALLNAARAVALLGAKVIICGITPETAQVVVNLGIDLSSIITCGDLQAALTLGLRASGYRITR